MQDVMSREQTIPIPADYFDSNSVFGLNFALITISWGDAGSGLRNGPRRRGGGHGRFGAKALNMLRFAAYIETSINNERR
jgi:hypothetical protein